MRILEENLTKKPISGSVCHQLKAFLTNMEENNLGGANSCVKAMTTQHWAEVKDWINAFKAVIQYRQRMG
jgi:hypothetical protein